MAEERGEGSFWDIGEPRKVLRRIENGPRSCDDLMSMIQERADVELRYAKGLRQWASKWDDSLRKGPEYGTILTALRTVLQEASAVAKIHEDCRMRLTGDEGPYYNVYKWKNDHFHRSGQEGLRETQQAKEAFAAAQREYAKLLSKLHRAKKAYFNASLAAYRARRFADEEASNPAVNAEALWKLRQRADGLALERERLKQVYLRRVMICNVTAKERYTQSMTSVFDRWQGFERERLDHIQSQLQLFVRNLNTHSGTGMGQVYQGILEQVRRAEPAADVDEWGRKNGTGSKGNWPKYEEIDPRRHQTDAEPSYRQLTTQQGTALATTDEMTDDFTTDDFDSEVDSAHDHARHQWPSKPDHAHQYANMPYRSHQHETQHYYKQWHPQDHWGQEDHQQRPPEPRYSQNEDLSERWLEEQLGGRGRRDDGRRWNQRKMRHEDVYHSHHHDKKHHAHVQRHWPPQDHHDDQRGHFHKGHKSKDRFQGHPEHQVHVESHHDHHHGTERSPGYHQHQGLSSSLYDTLGTSQSQESYIHDNHPSSTMLEQPANGGYHGNFDYHGNIESEDRSSPEEPYFQKHMQGQTTSHSRLVSAQTVSQTPEQTPTKIHTQTVQQMPTQTSSQVPAHRTPTAVHQEQVPTQTPTQTQQQTPGQTPAETTAQTYIERWNGAAERAAMLEQARQALQPNEGERLVRALYDFKPATRDEMALKQSEYLVQIGDHLSNGWAYGRKAGARGHFPASYVQVQ
ncbi:protein kinase C and casein kinase substrate in neurons protein 2-like [Patiria miniata]|uniref:Uncharacterized protein n=1 Tax=Patiria miniata TaxID=46514 RepID=A0A913YXT1_PATMI|nr:protein kinase C and casein kinase substrate in neurons protein 2-like [Patiria miniata]